MITFQCPTSQSFRSQYDSIAHQIATLGFAVIGAWNSEAAALLEVARRFGRIQMHIRANADGLTGISTASDKRDWHNYRSEYAGVTSEEFLPHTDGSFIHGLVPREDGSYIQLLPPKMLMLQCIQSAGSGGRNILIDGHEVYSDLRRQNGRCLDILSTKGCVTYCRDDQIALDRAVFEELDGGTVMLRFRYDFAAYVADWALEAFHTLQRDYFANPKYQRKLALSAGQILAVDNARMLHGREAFFDRRVPAEMLPCLARPRPAAGSAQPGQRTAESPRALAVPGLRCTPGRRAVRRSGRQARRHSESEPSAGPCMIAVPKHRGCSQVSRQ